MPVPSPLHRVVALAIILLLPSAGRAAIVNSLRTFTDAGPGWTGGIEGSYEASDGNTVETALKAGLMLQWRGERDTWRMMGTAKRKTARGIQTERSVLGHVRHNHVLSERWATVAFVQLQENPFQRLKLRSLVGVGARWEAARSDNLDLSLGATHMWEREQLSDADGHTRATRLSSFASLLTTPREGIHVDLTMFYQPRWSDFSDWRLFLQVELSVDLGANLELFSRWDLEHDEQPPAGVEPTDRGTTTGFRFRF